MYRDIHFIFVSVERQDLIWMCRDLEHNQSDCELPHDEKQREIRKGEKKYIGKANAQCSHINIYYVYLVLYCNITHNCWSAEQGNRAVGGLWWKIQTLQTWKQKPAESNTREWKVKKLQVGTRCKVGNMHEWDVNKYKLRGRSSWRSSFHEQAKLSTKRKLWSLLNVQRVAAS